MLLAKRSKTVIFQLTIRHLLHMQSGLPQDGTILSLSVSCFYSDANTRCFAIVNNVRQFNSECEHQLFCCDCQSVFCVSLYILYISKKGSELTISNIYFIE